MEVSGHLKKKKMSKKGFWFVFPAIVIVFFVQGYSLFITVTKSFTNWDGMFKNTFIGLQNYVNLINSGQFWLLLKNNLIFLLYVPINLLIGLVVAVLLWQECFGWKFFRAVLCLPQMLSAVIVGFLIKVFFSFNGPVNAILKAIDLEMLCLNWLGNGKTAVLLILFCLVWSNIGWQAMIFTGGLSGIDNNVIEAAIVDGAGYWKRLFYVILPMLGRVIEYSIITSVIFVFTGLFPLIFSITNGGPGYETTTIDYMIYLKAFIIGNDLGFSCALAVILLMIVCAVSLIEMKISDKLNEWGD